MQEEPKPQKMKPRQRPRKKSNARFICIMIVASFFLSVFFSYSSDLALQTVNTAWAFFILLAFIFIGVIFDVVGMAVASGDTKTFHSMAAKRVNGAKQSIWLLQNAERVSSFCNDVVGDICGIMSGTIGAIITVRIVSESGTGDILTSLLITGTVAAITIGGKACGKTVAVNSSETVVFFVGKIMYFVSNIFKKKR